MRMLLYVTYCAQLKDGPRHGNTRQMDTTPRWRSLQRGKRRLHGYDWLATMTVTDMNRTNQCRNLRLLCFDLVEAELTTFFIINNFVPNDKMTSHIFYVRKFYRTHMLSHFYLQREAQNSATTAVIPTPISTRDLRIGNFCSNRIRG